MIPDFYAVYDRLDAFVERKMRAAGTPGMAVALTTAEKLVRAGIYGYAYLGSRERVRPDTRFEIGSDGKAFTAIAILQEVEAGGLDLHTPVIRYLPWLQIRSRYEPITLHHLLSHTAGIIAGTDCSPDARAEARALRKFQTGFRPGDHYHYSDLGYKLLGLVLEEVSGQPYADLIRTRILEPLGMLDTDAAITHEARTRLAIGYRPLYDDRPSHPSNPLVPAPWIETNTGDGCIVSTVVDMAAFLRMLMHRGAGPNGRILSEASFELMIQPVIEMWDGVYYGYGIISSRKAGYPRLTHGGDMPGFESVWRIDLESGLGVTVLMNGPLASGIADYALALLRAVHRKQSLPPEPPIPDAAEIPNATDYAGIYLSRERELRLEADGSRLMLEHADERIALEARDEDAFYVAHPDFSRFLLTFGREGGQVVEAFRGSEWYTNSHYQGPTRFDYPADWEAYPGHYRAHNPWRSNFRVVLRKGALVMIEPQGAEEPLHPLPDGQFRVGDAEHSPEGIAFDMIVDGQALKVNVSGCDYFRFFTP